MTDFVLPQVLQITSVQLKGLGNVNLTFNLTNFIGHPTITTKNSDTYYVKSIDGLGPPDRDVAIADTASGGKFQGQKSQPRDIVVLIGLNPDYDKGETATLLRNNLYTMINTGYDPKVKVVLQRSVIPIATVDAYVTKFESEIFSKDPVVQITLRALNPTFTAPARREYDPSELDQKHPNVYNYGTAESGFQFGVRFTAPMSSWYIRQAENQAFGMTFKKAFATGDVLTVGTVPGNRYVHWKKNRGTVLNQLGILTTDSEWIAVHPGNNLFVVPPTGKWVWSGLFTFTPNYWGI